MLLPGLQVYSRWRCWVSSWAAAFAHSLRHSVDSLHLNASVVQQLESNVAKLGSLVAPSSVDSQTASTIRSAIAGSFIFGFRLIMLFCAGLLL